MKKILFTGGGSAGHVVPNLAIMKELRLTCDLSYMGTGGIEEKLVREAGYPFLRVDCPKLARSFTWDNFAIPVRLLRAVKEAKRLLSELRPDLVFSKGGYASYPAVRAAFALKIPVLTHESDLTPGLCTRMIAGRCKRVLTSFPDTAARFPNGKWVGSPIRRELFGWDRNTAKHKFGLPAAPVLLVFGGGSGSATLSEAVLRKKEELLEEFSILHIAGKGEDICERYPKTVYLRRSYVTDMGSAYAAADVVLSRAGSNTVFELAVLKKKAILVPLAHATRGDQMRNAEYFARKGLFKVLGEEELEELPAAAREVFSDEETAIRLKESGYTSGTPEIVKVIRETLSQEGARG